jgi:hypothetical protein
MNFWSSRSMKTSGTLKYFRSLSISVNLNSTD